MMTTLRHTMAAAAGLLMALTLLVGCEREPELHLFDGADLEVNFPSVSLELNTYWNYKLVYGINYDWEAEWYYGWDERDRQTFGELGYVEPTVFQLRRYYTGDTNHGRHLSAQVDTVQGKSFLGKYNWGFWDILVWNDIHTIDGVQNLNFDEPASLGPVTAWTNQTMRSSRYSHKYQRSFYQPEPLFAAYEEGIEISRDLKGFELDTVRNIYVKKLNMLLHPLTYIYLTQVILHNNNNKVMDVDGVANLSGMARSTVLNTGVTGSDEITVDYNVLFKKGCNMNGESVDIVGGRLVTFGMCNFNPNQVTRAEDVPATGRHFIDVTMTFNNGTDSTFVFDVTRQVRQRYKGGVITVELDMDTIPIPRRSGGSAFDAVVKDYEDGGTHEFEM